MFVGTFIMQYGTFRDFLYSRGTFIITYGTFEGLYCALRDLSGTLYVFYCISL